MVSTNIYRPECCQTATRVGRQRVWSSGRWHEKSRSPYVAGSLRYPGNRNTPSMHKFAVVADGLALPTLNQLTDVRRPPRLLAHAPTCPCGHRQPTDNRTVQRVCLSRHNTHALPRSCAQRATAQTAVPIAPPALELRIALRRLLCAPKHTYSLVALACQLD